MSDPSILESGSWRHDAAFLSRLRRAVSRAERHLTLPELKALVQRRCQAPKAWTMSGHLAACPLCRELFEALADEGPPIPESARARYRHLWTLRFPPVSRRRISMQWLYPLTAAAAGLLLLASAAHFFLSVAGHTPGNVLNGSGVLADGHGAILASGAALPARQEIVTETGMKFVLADGSQIAVAPRSRFRLATSWIGQATLHLSHGLANLSVTNQRRGRTLAVQTPLGKISVVGTRFRVTIIDSDPLAYQQAGNPGAAHSSGDQAESVVVSVTKGTVKVSQARREMLVNAGYSAILRRNQPVISLNPSAPVDESYP